MMLKIGFSDQNIVALVDCNNSTYPERVFDPPGRQAGGGVSNNDGCLVSRSNEVKALNIPMARRASNMRH